MFEKTGRTHVRFEARLPDRLRQAAAGPALPEGPVRQPARPARQGPVGAVDRRTERAGLRHDRRRKITKREAIVTQMVNKSAKADLRATKMLFDMMKEVEQKAGAAAPEPAKLTAPDREVVELFVARLRRQIAAEAAEAADADASEPPC